MASFATLRVVNAPLPDTKWRTMNFTKFHVSVCNGYYKSFQEWFTSNPRTVGQFLHPVELEVHLPPSMRGNLSLNIQHRTRQGTSAILSRDYFCCFLGSAAGASGHSMRSISHVDTHMASAQAQPPIKTEKEDNSPAIKMEHDTVSSITNWSYGDENASASSSMRWQRTSLDIVGPCRINCLFGFRAAGGSVTITFKLTTATDTTTTPIQVGLVGGSTADAKVSRKRKAELSDSPTSPVECQVPGRIQTRAKQQEAATITSVADGAAPKDSVTRMVTRRHSREKTSPTGASHSSMSGSPHGTPLSLVSSASVDESVVASCCSGRGAPSKTPVSEMPAAVCVDDTCMPLAPSLATAYSCCSAPSAAQLPPVPQLGEPAKAMLLHLHHMQQQQQQQQHQHQQMQQQRVMMVPSSILFNRIAPPSSMPYVMSPYPVLRMPHQHLPALVPVTRTAAVPIQIPPVRMPVQQAASISHALAPSLSAHASVTGSCCTSAKGSNCCGPGGVCACCPPPIDANTGVPPPPRIGACCSVPCHRPPVIAESFLGVAEKLDWDL